MLCDMKLKAAGDRVSRENLGYLPFPYKTVSQSLNQAHCANNFWYNIFVCSFLDYWFIMLIGRRDISKSWQKRNRIVYSTWSANVLNRIMDVSFFLCKAQLLNLPWISTQIISSGFLRQNRCVTDPVITVMDFRIVTLFKLISLSVICVINCCVLYRRHLKHSD